MADGDVIPGKFCSKCGHEMIAVMMDVGYAEALCPICDLHCGDRDECEEK